LNAEIADQHRMLMDEARGMDTKATLVAGFAAAAVSFLLANRRHTIWWLALAGYLTALGLALAALWPRHWNGLIPAALRDELSEAAPVFVVGQVAGSKVEIYEQLHQGQAQGPTLDGKRGVARRRQRAVGGDHDHGEAAPMTDTDPKGKTPPPPPRPPAPPKAQHTKARPRMQANGRLIGRSIIGSGAPRKRG